MATSSIASSPTVRACETCMTFPPGGGQVAQQRRECAGGVVETDAQLEEPPCGREPVPDHPQEHQRVDVAAGQDRDDRPVEPPGAAMSDATAAAPDGSTSIFARSATSRSARERSSSDTVRTGIRCAARMPNGTVPGSPTAMPSAIVRMAGAGTGWPAASDAG